MPPAELRKSLAKTYWACGFSALRRVFGRIAFRVTFLEAFLEERVSLSDVMDLEGLFDDLGSCL
jgi:hypothetical protein